MMKNKDLIGTIGGMGILFLLLFGFFLIVYTIPVLIIAYLIVPENYLVVGINFLGYISLFTALAILLKDSLKNYKSIKSQK